MMESGKKTHKSLSIYHFPYDFIKWTALPAAWLIVRPRRIYENENAKKHIRGGAILISNHIGFMDPIYLMTGIVYRRHKYICIQDFFERKVAKFFFRIFQCIPIDRANFQTDTFRTIVDHLKNNEMLVMFPEGRINFETETTAGFKSGMVLMALQSGKPIVPVYIRKRKHLWNRVKMVIGEPVDVKSYFASGPSFTKIEEITNLLHSKEKQFEEICIKMEEKA